MDSTIQLLKNWGQNGKYVFQMLQTAKVNFEKLIGS